jgi:RNA polymerase sigma-70 factor, ECF subfamily
MGYDDFLAERFEAHRRHLRAVAHRMLRLRRSRVEEPLETAPQRPGITPATTTAGPGPGPVPVPDPEQDARLADSVGDALLVVLDTLTPAERLSFVLHDLFAVPYDDIAAVVGESPAAARQLAGRARRRVRGAQAPDADLARQREVVEAFLAAARAGEFDALVAVLDPDVVARTEVGVTTGAAAVARGASRFSRRAGVPVPVLVDGRTGMAVFTDGRMDRVLAFTVVRDRITVIDITTDPARLALLDVDLL